MKKLLLLPFLLCSLQTLVFATGEPSTYFNIFVPPNNDAVKRDVSLIVTAIYDSTYFEIIDDDFDGDADDSKSGYLMAGQSYVLYIKDNGINDDARYASGGVLKPDGDYFTIRSDKLVYASQSTKSDWQHDWVPSIDKSSIGEKFILYVPPGSYSNRDLNVFAFEEGETNVSIRKISITPTIITSFTNVDDSLQNIVANFTVSPGIDAIHATTPGRNLLESGDTYIIETNKKVSLQYGALWQNERDGGGYVPSSNGSSSGELFYFAVPYQVSLEQEVRIVSWDEDNNVQLSYYNGSSWINLDNWNLGEMQTGDWVGKNVGESHQNVFRVECSPGKKVSVFEANWLETGSPGTSDIATMVSSEAGTTAGDRFLVYMAPPGYEYNVIDPFTGEYFQYPMSHAYIFAGNDTVSVTVKDAYTNGQEISRTYEILPGRYVDCGLNINEWRSIYNGDGNPNSGPERPYLLIESDKAVSVMNTNFNDNWMMYFGTSLEQGFMQQSIGSENMVSPGENIIVSTDLILNTTNDVNNVSAEVIVGSGLEIVSSEFVNNTDNLHYNAEIQTSGSESKAVFDSLPDLDPAKSYSINTEVKGSVNYNNNQPIEDGTVVTVESTVTGSIDGQIEQSVITQGLEMDTDNTAFMLFSKIDNATTLVLTDTWNSSWVDVNNDGWDDLYVSTYDKTKANILYINNGDGSFTSTSAGAITSDKGGIIASSWADIDNDGDWDVYNAHNIDSKDGLYTNEGGLEFSSEIVSLLSTTNGYHHGAAWADYDNDGFVDVFISDFMPTRFNVLLKNNGNGTFSEIQSEPMTQETGRSIGATWADYNNDGFQDLFVPNGNKENNALYKNLGNGRFEKVENDVVVRDSSNSVASCWGDFDNDKDLDLFVTTASGGKNLFYANNGDGSFTKMEEGNPSNDKGNSHGCSFVDVDNDGWLDLYVLNDQNQSKFLYLNNGDGTFTKNTNEVVTSAFGNTYSDSWSDFDRDGDLDLYVSTHSDEKNLFFINNGTDNNWAEFKLIGNLSNKSAIGTRINLKSNGVWQTREINAQSGFGGQNSIISHFGLGNAATIDSMLVAWPSGIEQVFTNVAINTITTIQENEGAIVRGKVYIDANNNCQLDEGEQSLSNVALEIVEEDRRIYTNKSGVFSTTLPVGDFTIKVLPSNNWSACVNTLNANISSVNDTITGLNFGLKANAEFHDLSIKTGATAFRRGFLNTMVVTVKNEGTLNSTNDTLRIEFPEEIHLLESTIPLEKTGNKYQLVIDELAIGEELTIQITDSVGLPNMVGDSIAFLFSISEKATESNTENNTVFLQDEVVGAIDPNDILVWPQGEGFEGYIPKDQVVTYRVRFQNTGSFYAQNVTIYNQLPAIVDPESITDIVSSHEYELTLDGDKMVWSFKNIYLPDSSESLVGSQGFAQYRIKVKETVFGGEVLPNSADIVFDYEAPVNTKQVNNTIKYASSPDDNTLMVWPNPANDKVKMRLQDMNIAYEKFLEITSCEILDASGVPVFQGSINQSEFELSLDRLNLSSGMYLIKVMDELGNTYSSKLIKN